MADFKKLNGYKVKDEKARDDWKYQTQTYQPSGLQSIILGSYAIDYDNFTPSAALLIDNKFYCFNPTNHADNMGDVYIYDVATNNLETVKHILLGHANGVCYDGTNIYVVMNRDYSTDSDSDKILKYDLDFNLLATFNLGQRCASISYDWVEKQLYVKASSLEIYKFDGAGTFELIGTVELPSLNISNNMIGGGNSKWNQSFAVYNGHGYFSSPYKRVCEVELSTMKVINNYIVTDMDTTCRRYLKELEDFEFTENGHLIGVRFTDCDDKIYMAYVCEFTTNLIGSWTASNDGIDIVRKDFYLRETDKNKFFKSISYLSHLYEIYACVIPPKRITIQGNVIEDYVFELWQDLELIIEGSYTCKGFDLYKNLTLRGDGTLIFTGSYDIYISGTGILKFNTNTRLNITPTGNDFIISTGNYFSPIIIRRKPTNTKGGGCYVANTNYPMEDNSFWIGANKVQFA